MVQQFIPGHRYKFSKEAYLTNTANVLKYENIKALRDLIDTLDGKEVFDGYIGTGEMKFAIDPAWTEEILSRTRQIIREIAEGGKTMKLSEVIAKLEENPRLKFETTDDYGYYCVFEVSENGYFHLNIYKKKGGTLIGQHVGGGAFNGNVRTSMQWRQVQEPVDFMTAFKAWQDGKTIRAITRDGEVKFKKGIRDFYVSIADIENGKWYIE